MGGSEAVARPLKQKMIKGQKLDAFALMTAAIGIQIGIGTEIDEKARNSTPIAIAISISTVRMCHN
jgi:hypothetical protein